MVSYIYKTVLCDRKEKIDVKSLGGVVVETAARTFVVLHELVHVLLNLLLFKLVTCPDLTKLSSGALTKFVFDFYDNKLC